MAILHDVDSVILYSYLYFFKPYLKNISFLPDPVDGAVHNKNYTSGCTALHMGPSKNWLGVYAGLNTYRYSAS